MAINREQLLAVINAAGQGAKGAGVASAAGATLAAAVLFLADRIDELEKLLAARLDKQAQQLSASGKRIEAFERKARD
jgi:hypothetical protein